LLAFFVGNDVMNNSYALEGNPESPYFVVRDGRLSEDPVIPERRRRTLRYAFAYASRYSRLFDRRSGSSNAGPRRDACTIDCRPTKSSGGCARACIDPGRRKLGRRLAGHRGADTHHARRRASHDSQFLLATFSSTVVVYPDPGSAAGSSSWRGLPIRSEPPPRPACRRRADPSLGLTEPMQQHAEAHRCFLHRFRQHRAPGPAIGTSTVMMVVGTT
jgi:hypothetical protein